MRKSPLVIKPQRATPRRIFLAAKCGICELRIVSAEISALFGAPRIGQNPQITA